MSEPVDRTFFAVFEALPRQGPGSRDCSARALAMCPDLPASPEVVDLGCGSGAQTVDVAELTGGTVVAVDAHLPFAAMVAERAAARGLVGRVRTITGDMAASGLPDGCADLVWSEGALYNLGLERALPLCRGLLRPGGYLAFTDAVWLTDEVPAAVRAVFADYPTMGSVSDALDAITRAGFEVVGHFPLAQEAWWDDFYTPMRSRVAELRADASLTAEALAVLDECDAEIDVRAEHGDTYGYEWFVARRPVA